MKASDVYLKAAKLVESDRGNDGLGWASCYAVNAVVHGKSGEDFTRDSAEGLWYARLFAPVQRDPDFAWGEAWSDDPAERKTCRILALCFMAAIAESEGD